MTATSRITLLLVLTFAGATSAFAPQPIRRVAGAQSVVVAFGGLFDFFSEEAKAKREAEKQRLVREQEAVQREILERRVNPEMEAEYFASVMQRRKQFDELDDGRTVEVQGKEK